MLICLSFFFFLSGKYPLSLLMKIIKVYPHEKEFNSLDLQTQPFLFKQEQKISA
jgi:hypothetical protein